MSQSETVACVGLDMAVHVFSGQVIRRSDIMRLGNEKWDFDARNIINALDATIR